MTRTVRISRDLGFMWWWNVVGSGRYGHAWTERGARRKAAKALLETEAAQSHDGFEQWDAARARRYL